MTYQYNFTGYYLPSMKLYSVPTPCPFLQQPLMSCLLRACLLEAAGGDAAAAAMATALTVDVRMEVASEQELLIRLVTAGRGNLVLLCGTGHCSPAFS